MKEDESGPLAAVFPPQPRDGRHDVSARKEGEAVFLQSRSQTPIAWFPVRMDLDSVYGLTWAGRSGSEFYVLRLEGEDKTQPQHRPA